MLPKEKNESFFESGNFYHRKQDLFSPLWRFIRFEF